jgi:predicted HTH transcriptional regulator/REP element-mobilizing transposase RayT
MDWNGIDRIWFLTWTTYGTWLPGDERGFVSPKFEGDIPERRNNEPGRPYDEGGPDLRRIAENKLAGDPVRLTPAQAEVVRRQFEETASYRGWQLLAGAIMANHVHLVVGVPGDPDPSALLRDFKSYSSRALNLWDRVSVKPRWWTEQGSKRKIADWDTLETVLRYVREQAYALEVWDAVNRDDAARGGGGGPRGAAPPPPPPPPTAGTLLLFGRSEALRRFLPTHEAAFQVLRGLEVEVNDFLPYPLLRLAEEMFTRFQARNAEEELQFGMFRVAVSTYSETAFREALANGLIHRDYTQRGAVHVQWSEDQLEISSPGGFPSGIRLDNLLVAPPHPRSPLLADAFKRTGLVERTGRGINRMFAEQLRVGRPAPDYGRSSDAYVVAVLPGGPANLSMTRWVLEQENQQGMPLRLAELQVLTELVRERRATTTELARVMQRTDAEARNILARMVERGWIEARGDGKGRSWHLSAAVYRVLDAPAGYVRVHGFEPLQQEQMVLQYVDAHGQITRTEAAELCSLTPDQASRLLRRLVKEGKLELRGERRGSDYVRPTR